MFCVLPGTADGFGASAAMRCCSAALRRARLPAQVRVLPARLTVSI
jgi:hypothetical protein